MIDAEDYQSYLEVQAAQHVGMVAAVMVHGGGGRRGGGGGHGGGGATFLFVSFMFSIFYNYIT
jgi:hypothetical protein